MPFETSEILRSNSLDYSTAVFTIKELEKHPDVKPGALREDIQSLPAEGSAESRGGPTEEQLDLAQAALLRVRAACRERSIDLRPAFREHDQSVSRT